MMCAWLYFIFKTTCSRIQPCSRTINISFDFRRYGSMPHYMRFHRFTMSKIHCIMLCRRYNYVLTVFNNSSPLTLILFITYNRIFFTKDWGRTSEFVKFTSLQVYFQSRHLTWYAWDYETKCIINSQTVNRTCYVHCASIIKI